LPGKLFSAADAPIPTPPPAAPPASAAPTAAPPAMTVALVVEPPEPKVGQKATVRIVGRKTAGLFGVQMQLTYDPKALQVADADPAVAGAPIAMSAVFPKAGSFVAMNKLDPDKGVIEFAVTLLGPARSIQGDVELASFVVTPLRAGVAEIGFGQVLLADQNAQPLRATVVGLSLGVKD
ncbi:MAG: cohesin domain-containing protein, partial [Chloroflexota bacterium]